MDHALRIDPTAAVFSRPPDVPGGRQDAPRPRPTYLKSEGASILLEAAKGHDSGGVSQNGFGAFPGMTNPSEDVFARAAGAVTDACAGMGPTWLLPEAFFVARSGVLTLAFSGYASSVLALKARLDSGWPMPAERPGSRWPKSTLAALRTNEPLTTDEIVLLKEATARAGTCLLRRARPIGIDGMEVVELRDRSMEKVGRVEVVALSGEPDSGAVDVRSRAAVNAVLSQWRREGLPQYVPDLFRPGFREDHYRSSHHELSLVIRMAGRLPCLDVFRSAVESRLPGRYAWFASECLHVTVRSLGDLEPSTLYPIPPQE